MRGEPIETAVMPAPLPRRILVPILLVVSVGFALAATPTPAGRALFAPAYGSVELYHLGASVIRLLVALAIVGASFFCLIGGLVRGKSDWLYGALGLGILIVVLTVGSYLMYLAEPGTWRSEWNDYVEPFRWFVGLFR
jgi:hypothetical protein